MTTYFTVTKRNPGHWDISDQKERLFSLRGCPGRFIVLDEREGSRAIYFATITTAMSFITDALMFEEIQSDGLGNNVPVKSIH